MTLFLDSQLAGQSDKNTRRSATTHQRGNLGVCYHSRMTHDIICEVAKSKFKLKEGSIACRISHWCRVFPVFQPRTFLTGICVGL